METRRIKLDVFYKGTNISKFINADLISCSYNDSAESVADDISISLNDVDGKWLKEWICNTSDEIELKIIETNWNNEDEIKVKNCGLFIVDEPEYTIFPSVFSLNAISIPADRNFKDVEKTKVWKKATVRKIAETIAANNNLILNYDVSEDFIIETKEQTNQSDMAFLQDICSENALCLKIYNKKIVIFSETEYENKEPVLQINKNMMTSCSLKRCISDSGFDGCVLKYKKNDGVLVTAEYFPTNKKDKILQINENVENQAEALKKVKAKLREKNKKEYTISFDSDGVAPFWASDCIELVEDFGQFNGKYYIDSIRQSVAPTSYKVQAHKVLGY